MHISGKTDEDDRCECIRAWDCVCVCVCVCVGVCACVWVGVGWQGDSGVHVCMMGKCRIDMGAQ